MTREEAINALEFYRVKSQNRIYNQKPEEG